MISFNLHIPSIVIGFFLGYIVVSILWFIFSFNENWDRGFGDDYKACSEYYKSKKTKNDKIHTESEK